MTAGVRCIAGNGSGGSGPDVSGAFSSHGHNLVGNVGTATEFNAAGDNSLAGDSNNNALTTDQRGAGFADSADADTTQTVDIGVFEAHPTVEDIADKQMSQDASLSFNFNVGDAALGLTSVAASSSDASLVPNDAGHISVSGSGSLRTLGITPVAGGNGTTTITVTANADNGRSAADTFVLSVTPNRPPGSASRTTASPTTVPPGRPSARSPRPTPTQATPSSTRWSTARAGSTTAPSPSSARR
jgi:hypothetical protein